MKKRSKVKGRRSNADPESGVRGRGLGKDMGVEKTLLTMGFRLSALGFLLIVPLALAGQARLELEGKAQVIRSDGSAQSYNRSGGVALNLNLEVGDRLCVIEGKGRLSYGVKAYTLTSPGASCFEVAKPKSFWDNLVASCQDIGVCKKEAEKAFAKEAKSRGAEGSTSPLYLPADYSLPSLSLPIAGGQRLRLMNASGKELLTLDSDTGGLFVLPTDKLKVASRVEVQNGSGVTVYAAPVRWVRLESEVAPANPHEAALSLWLTQNLGYAPAAYSYLLASGDSDLAKTLETQIRAEFKGEAR